jgi:hypothetical protein
MSTERAPHVSVDSAPTAAAQFGQCRHQIGTLVAQPALIEDDHFVARAVAFDS